MGNSKREIFKIDKCIRKVIIGIMILGGIAIHFLYLDKYPLIWCDDILNNAEPVWSFIKRGSFASYAVFNDKFKHLEISNVMWGRIFFLMNAFFVKLFGLGALQIRLVSFISGFFSLLILYYLAKKLFNQTIAFLTVLFLSLSSFFTVRAHLGRPDMTVTMVILLVVYIFLIGKEKKSLVLLMIAGLLSALNLDVHPPGGIISLGIIGVLSIFYFKDIRFKGTIMITVGVLLGVIWWICWHVLPFPKLFFSQWNNYWSKLQMIPVLGNINGLLREFHRYYTFFWEGKGHRNMFLLLVFLISLFYNTYYNKTKNEGLKLLLLILFTSVMCFIFFVPNKTSFYLIYIFPFFILYIIGTLYQIKNSGKFNKAISLILIIGLGLFFLLEQSYIIVKFKDSNYNSYIQKIKKHIPEGEEVLGPTHCWLGLVRSNLYYMDYFGYWELSGHSEISLEECLKFIKEKNINYIIINEDGFLWWWKERENFIQFVFENASLVGEVKDNFYGEGDLVYYKKDKIITQIYRLNS